ncbi:MAG TPA: hypothetical protein VIE63_04390 [Ramlibacter sp.]|jgi:uncharacterized protein with PQ loop repeat
MTQLRPHPGNASRHDPSGWLDKILPVLSIFTMALTVPQVWGVWVDHQTAGVSLLSWGAYTFAACLWLVDGLRKKDKTIWVACIGWIVLDAAVFIGVLVQR